MHMMVTVVGWGFRNTQKTVDRREVSRFKVRGTQEPHEGS